MPRDLQADVVVPIVNFMYTGTLEFEIRMYERLLKTARDMKMSVLLKLLEAHRRAIPPKPAPIVLNRGVAGRPAMRGGGYVPPSTRGRPPGRPPGSSYFGAKTISVTADHLEESSSDFERLRRAGNENPTGKRPFTSVSNRSISPPQKKPNLQDVKEYTEAARLRHQLNDDGDDGVVGDYDVDDTYSQSSGDNEETTPRQSMSLLSNNSLSQKSPRVSLDANTTTATVTLQEVPGKKIDHAQIISEVMKKYPHLLKSHKNIKLKITQKAPQAGGLMEVQINAEASPSSTAAAKGLGAATTPVGRALLASKQQMQQQQTASGSGRGGKTVLGGRSLVATGKSTNTAFSIIKSVSASAPAPVAAPSPAPKGNRIDSRTMHRLISMGAENMEGPWLCLRCGVDGKPIGIPTYRAFRKHLINTHNEKINSRLCEHCGFKSANGQELYHHLQVKHNVMPPKGVAYPVCKTCKYVAIDKTALTQHEQEHGHGPQIIAVTRSKAVAAAPAPVTPPQNVSVDKGSGDFECPECGRAFTTRKAMSMHRVAKHRSNRGRRAKARLTVDEEETEPSEEEEEDDDDAEEEQGTYTDDGDYVPPKQQQTTTSSGRKIKILSNVSIKGKTRSSEADSLTTVATGIATSLGLGTDDVVVADSSADMTEYHEEEVVDETRLIEEALANVHGGKAGEEVATKFIAEDGSELQLTAEQKAELMSQLESNGGGGEAGEDVVMMYEGVDEVAVTESADVSVEGAGAGEAELNK